jgi:hypothetical protein
MVRNILAVILGWIAGSVVNIALIMVNMMMMPAGTNFTTPEAVSAALANMQAINFVIVFLAHAQ